MDAIALLILRLLICQILGKDTYHVIKKYKDGLLNIHNNVSGLRYNIDV